MDSDSQWPIFSVNFKVLQKKMIEQIKERLHLFIPDEFKLSDFKKPSEAVDFLAKSRVKIKFYSDPKEYIIPPIL